MAYILLIEPNAPMVAIWFRDADRSWQERRSEGLDGNVDLPELSLTLPLRAIYEDINLASP